MRTFQQTLEHLIDQLDVFTAEAVLASGAMLLLLLVRWKPRVELVKSLTTLVIVFSWYFMSQDSSVFFDGDVVHDELNIKVSRILLLSTLLILGYPRKQHQSIEFHFFLLAGLVGAFFVMKSQHLLLIYLGIETLSFSSYFLTGMRMKAKSSEATLKYVLFGAVTTSVMLYGISIMYGASGSLLIQEMVFSDLSIFGISLFFAGLLFKSSLIPFHLWTPSTYQEAPTDAVAYLSIVPKLAAFVLIYHVMQAVTEPLNAFFTPILMLVAMVTVLWGTVSAVPQVKVKRMLAYGAIAHSGFLLPMVLMGQEGIVAFSYYAVIYALMNVGIFLIVHFHEDEKERSLKFSHLSGLGKNAPLFSVAALIFLVALIGLPPTSGFAAKLLLFTSVFTQFQMSGDYLWMTYLVVGILSTVLSLYYYLQVPIYYFLKSGKQPSTLPSKLHVMFATILAMLVLWVFIQPEILNSFVIT